MKKVWLLIILSFCCGCCVIFSRKDISQNYEYMIGKTFLLKSEAFVVHDLTEDIDVIDAPDSPYLPSLKEYKEKGKTSNSMLSDNKIIGIVGEGEALKVLSFEEVSWTGNKLIYMKVLRIKDKKEYKICSGNGLFSDSKKYGITFNPNRIEQQK